MKKFLFTKLLDLDLKEGLQALSQEEESRRVVIKVDIEFLAYLEEIYWRQKSKALFIKEGDNNTWFFHRLANSHRKTNHIRSVEVDGMLYEGESSVLDQVVDFYKKIYQKPESWRPTINGLEFDCLDETERLSLEREFEKEDILEALKEAEGDKELGPDGFTMAFFKKCYSVVERDVMAFFTDFLMQDH